MIFRLAGAFLVVISSGTVGILLSKRLGDRVRILITVDRMLESFSTQMRFKAATMEEILQAISQNPLFYELTFIKNALQKLFLDQSCSFQEAWCSSVEAWAQVVHLPAVDRQAVYKLGSQLGSSDIDGELSTIALSREEIHSLIHSAEQDYTRRGKLFRSLGVLGGVFVAILLV